jgi:hypothetical protein
MSSFAPSALPQVAPPDPTKHVNYSLGMVLGVDDFTQEFAYLSGHDQRIVRDLIGYGVVAGLRVTVDVGERGPRVQVAPGEAVTPSGRLVCVSPAQCAYLNDWLQVNRHDIEALGSPPPSSVPLAVVLCYRECETDDVPIPGEPCRTDAELMAPSRLAESFTLDLRIAPVAQLEEDAVRDFVAWVRSVPRTSGPGPGVDAFVDALRSALGLEASPPLSPPDLLGELLGSPPAGIAIPSHDAEEYYRALVRFWVEELRPRLRSASGAECGCGAGGIGALDPDADCITLAELEIPVDVDGISGGLVVADTPPVGIDDSRRPTLLHLRLLQEILLGGGGDGGGGDGGPQLQLSVEGRVEVDGSVAPGSGPLAVTTFGAAPAIYLVDFPGFDASSARVVLGQAESAFAATSPSTFEVIPSDDANLIAALGGPPGTGVVVRSRRFDGSAAPFSLRVVQLGAMP